VWKAVLFALDTNAITFIDILITGYTINDFVFIFIIIRKKKICINILLSVVINK